ncbi:MAG: hypothetical protein LBQ61_08075 [Spirochaetales bacterium]|jgi:hypothetical protein|nr:hypothetical protein [Spirochaetales bacterium]
MLEKETVFFEAHEAELREKYLGKRVVIYQDKILGVYDSYREALDETSKTMNPGSFMIKYIPEDPEETNYRFLNINFNHAR